VIASLEANQERVDQIILGEGSLDELKPFLPDRESRLVYYSERISELIPTNIPKAECESCHCHSAERRVVFRWRGVYHTAGTAVATIIGLLMAMSGHGVLVHRRIDFETTHGLCGVCLKQMRLRTVGVYVVEKLCFILLILSLLVFVPMLLFAPVVLFLGGTTRREILVSFAGLFGGGAIALTSLLAADRLTRWHVPKSLRFISKRPFQLVGLQDFESE
jgi:hypothetical protein